MLSPGHRKPAGVTVEVPGRILRGSSRRPGRGCGCVAAVCLVLLVLAPAVWGRMASHDEGFAEIGERGFDQIDRINEALRHYGRTFLWVGLGLSALLVLKIVAPAQIYYGFQDGRLRRAVRNVDELLKRIQKEAETTSEAPSEETTAESGLLAGMAEIAEFEHAVQVPSYVLTVNDLMLDNMAVTLRRLRRFRDGSAEKYQDHMFTVLDGIKTITEHSAEAGVASGLAVDIKQYYQDDRRYRTWRKVLDRWARRGRHQETAEAFLVFMRKVREGRSMAPTPSAAMSLGDTAVMAAQNAPTIPEVLSEETLPAVEEAAVEEARNLCTLIQTGTAPPKGAAWQFEFVRRQEQIRTRDEAQRMLSVFLNRERKVLREITKVRMLPCRTWGHVLHMLGVDDAAHLERRIVDRLLTTQEILVLEKVFLQTFARRESLERIYRQPGSAKPHAPNPQEQAGLMIDVHIPEIRRETLALLRRLRQRQPDRLEAATDALNEEETPQNGQVRKLIQHYVK